MTWLDFTPWRGLTHSPQPREPKRTSKCTRLEVDGRNQDNQPTAENYWGGNRGFLKSYGVNSVITPNSEF